MDQCPVCTLYLREGMSLGAHLDTHPKDQVIRALCSIAKGSRRGTPYDSGRSEGSFRSRSRTPACDSGRHRRRSTRASPAPGGSYRSLESADSSPEARFTADGDGFSGTRRTLEPARVVSTPSLHADSSYSESPAVSAPPPESLERIYLVSRNSAEADVSTGSFSRQPDYLFCNERSGGDSVESAPVSFAQPRVSARASPCDTAKSGTSKDRPEVEPPPALHYVTTNLNPVHFVLPASPSFSRQPDNVVMAVPPTDVPRLGDTASTTFPGRFTSLSSVSFRRPGPAVTQAPQIVYRESSYVNGKQFLSTVPAIPAVGTDHREINAKTGAMYRNVMVFNPFSGASCLYPQQPAQEVRDLRHQVPALLLDGLARLEVQVANAILPEKSQSVNNEDCALLNRKNFTNDGVKSKGSEEVSIIEDVPMDSGLFADWGDVVDFGDATAKNSGVKILSNIKVELPVQNNGPVAESVDLTPERDHRSRPDISAPDLNTDEATLPDFIDREICDSYDRSRFYRQESFCPTVNARRIGEMETSTPRMISIANTFSVIKNIGNPNLYKDGSTSSAQHSEEPEPCALPDLTCNEKPSVSPCSDLTNDSNEGSYDRLGQAAETSGHPSRRTSLVPARFSSSPVVTRSTTRKNLFVKKPKKILRIKNLNKRDTKKASEKPVVNVLDSGEGTSVGSGLSSAGHSRTGGFFKEIDKIRKNSTLSMVAVESHSRTVGEIYSEPPADDSMSFIIDKREPSGDDESKNSSQFEGSFSATPTSGEDILKAILEERVPSRVDGDLEAVRPVNVIAFGAMLSGESATVSLAGVSSKTSQDSNRFTVEKRTSNELIRESYAEFFSAGRESFEDGVADGVQKIEVCIVEEDVTKDGEYVWDETPQKEEFAFANFMRGDYSQAIYTRTDGGEGKESDLGGPEGQRVPGHFSAEDICGDEGDYVELLCPQDAFLDRDHKGSFLEAVTSGGCLGTGVDMEGNGHAGEAAALNIRTDERMPPRGELSEQDSSGDVDAPWAGMYHDVVGGSTSYDLIARETWPSDGSDIDMPISPTKHAFETEDIPIVVGVKPPDKNYKCATCGKSFNCPKERRVHRSKEHPVAAVPGDSVDIKKTIRKRRPPLVKTNIKIKSEKVVKNEGLSSLSNSKMDLTDEGVMNLKLVDGVLTPDMDAVDNKPKLEIVKEETKKRKREYTCVTCKLEFFTDISYHEHLKIHPLECLTCGKFFNRRANLQLHIKRHLGIKNFRCDVCDKRFITKQKMAEHHNIHVLCAPIKCNMCDETFRRHSNMVQHRNRHHLRLKRRPRDHVCHCGEVFHSKKKLLWHKEVHEEKPKACPHCSERFVHAASLTRHMRRAHNNYYVPDERRKRENVQCPVCGNVYLKSSMDMHLRTHTGAKPFSCVICSKSFSTKWNLKLHRWTHANRSSKPFKCALCKGAFVRRADYVSHMNAHRSVRPYTCNHCGCRFIRKYNCQRHVREHETAKRHACPVPDCGKTFHRGYYLSEHMRVHSGARPFSCNICGKASSTKSNHNKHLKIHHAKEPVARED